MSRPEQSVQEAQLGTDKFINDMLQPTGNWLEDMVQLGRALHASDDQYSESHNFQKWYGGYDSFDHWWRHTKADLWPKDWSKLINAERDLIRRYRALRQGSGRKG